MESLSIPGSLSLKAGEMTKGHDDQVNQYCYFTELKEDEYFWTVTINYLLLNLDFDQKASFMGPDGTSGISIGSTTSPQGAHP